MNRIPRPVRIVLAIVAGLVVGSVVNMALVMVSGKVIPPPAGADVTTTEGLRASMHLLEPRHFLFPFLAHALGTLVGAIVAALLAPACARLTAYSVGALFLIGGVTAAFMVPAPAWFIAVDLLLAYLPMAWIGCRLVARGVSRSGAT